jgi:hypothetical protein
MASPLNLEDHLILACARTDPDVSSIENMAARGPAWEGFVRKTQRLGLIPLVHTSLRQAAGSGHVPKSVSEHLRHINHREAVHSIRLQEALGAILLRFAEKGVPVILIRETALAAHVYPSPTLRPMKGIHLLVKRRDLGGVDELLRTMSYACSSPTGYRRAAYLGPDGFPQVEIHDDILMPGSDEDLSIPIEDLWNRSRPPQIAQVGAFVFSPEDLLLHLALQFSTGFVGQLATLCDVRETCKRFGGDVDWSRLCIQAQAYKSGKYLYFALWLARDLLAGNVPLYALADLRATFRQLPLAGKFVAAVIRQAILWEDYPASLARKSSYGAAVALLGGRHAREGVVNGYRFLTRSCQAYVGKLVKERRRSLESWNDSADSGLLFGKDPACLTPQPVGLRPRTGEVAVTYDQQFGQDGVGSQLHRIYGLYALARALHVKYVHTPIARIGYQGLLPLLEGRSDPDFAARYNAFYSLPSDEFDLERCERVGVEHVEQGLIERCRNRATETGRPVLIQGFLPYRYVNQHPETYHALRTVSPYREYRPAGPVRVCIHMRRGDNSVPHRQDEDVRLLPNTYYLRVCDQVVRALRERGVPFVVRLHTEIPPRPYTLYPDNPGLFFKLHRPATIDPAQFALEEFESLPNLEMVLNVEAREALDDFATADVLILSPSSLGYVGGMLNPHGLVIWAPPFHVPLPDWLVADKQGVLDEAQLATRVADYLDRREHLQSGVEQRALNLLL